MNWDDVKKNIGNVAPSLLAAIGSFVPVPGASTIGGLAGKVLQQVLGTDDADKVADIISTDPNIALKLREAEMAAQLENKKIELEMSKLQLLDTQNAREREKLIIQTIGRDWDKRFLTVFGVVAPLGILVGILIYGLPNLNNDLVLLFGNLTGIMFAKYGTIFDYHLGTSLGMERSNTSWTLGKAIEKLPKS